MFSDYLDTTDVETEEEKYLVKVTKVFLSNWKLNLAVKTLFNHMNDVKIFGNNFGYNKIYGERWGSFKIKRRENFIVLDYSIDNLTILKNIEDVIIPNNNDYNGEMFFKDKKILEFTMTRI